MTMVRFTDGRRPDGTSLDLYADNGVFVEPAEPTTTVDLSGRTVLPAFAEPHAHLDKALLASRFPNPVGDLIGAIEVMRAGWITIDEDDVIDRATRVVRRLVAAGTTLIRSHADTNIDAGTTAIRGLTSVREAVKGICDLEVVAMANPLTGPEGDDGKAVLDEAIEIGCDVLGAVPYIEDSPEATVTHILHLAKETGLPVDLHMDEVLDASVDGLTGLAREVIRHGLEGRVTASHCVSHGLKPESEQRRIAEALAEAGISVVTLPRTNLFLQARGVAQAPPRATAGIAALLDAGVNVAGGADNVQDPFFSIGRCDPLETAALLVAVCHQTPDRALEMITDSVRRLTHRRSITFETGSPADFVAIDASSAREAIADQPPGRTVVHRGKVVAETRVETIVAD